MKILNFISWWSNQYTFEDKLLVFLLSLLVIVPLIGWMLSLTFFFTLFLTLGVFISGVALAVMYDAISKRWKKYTAIKEREAEQIIQNLKYGKL